MKSTKGEEKAWTGEDDKVRKATLEFIPSRSLSKPGLLRNEPACAVEIKIIFRGCLEGKDEVPEDDTET